MSAILAPARVKSSGEIALHGAAAFWLCAALAGQWAFLYYIVSFYGGSLVSGNFEAWNRLAAFGRTPFVAGDTAGNVAFLAHALGAGLIAFGGALQLVPQIRKMVPRFHRWNGRVFLFTVVALSLSGFYLVWLRGEQPESVSDLSTSFNGLLILAFAYLAYRHARARNIPVHRRWAMRLYLVANAQWFMRVGVFSYFMIHQLFGLQADFSDPFLQFWTFGCYLVPLAVLEIYLRAKDSGDPVLKHAVAIALFVLTLLMSAGIFAYAIFAQKLASGAPLVLPG